MPVQSLGMRSPTRILFMSTVLAACQPTAPNSRSNIMTTDSCENPNVQDPSVHRSRSWIRS